MRTVGLLLVSALMIVPVATAQQVTRSFRTTLLAAMLLGVGASFGGLMFSALAADVPAGPTILLLALACFVLTWPLCVLVRLRRRRLMPFHELYPLAHTDIADLPPHHC